MLRSKQLRVTSDLKIPSEMALLPYIKTLMFEVGHPTCELQQGGASSWMSKMLP